MVIISGYLRLFERRGSPGKEWDGNMLTNRVPDRSRLGRGIGWIIFGICIGVGMLTTAVVGLLVGDPPKRLQPEAAFPLVEKVTGGMSSSEPIQNEGETAPDSQRRVALAQSETTPLPDAKANPQPMPRPSLIQTKVVSALRQPTPTAVQNEPVPKLGIGASLNGKRLFPADNAWNKDISRVPVDRLSDRILSTIGLDKHLHPDFGTVYEGAPNGIPYIVITGEQAKRKVFVKFEYEHESDPGPYPIPPDAPIEGGPKSTGDRHILVLDRDNWMLYELFNAYPDGNGWKAGSGAIYDLYSNDLRPAGWTSADAAGLPIFPGLVRYDEVMERKEINHALRFTVRRSRRAYVHPARHFASRSEDENLPPMGMRVRLKASVDISKFSANTQVILRALKKYGMILADNGGDWFLSGAPDPRWNDEEIATLKRIKIRDFEVIRMGDLITR